MDYEKILDFAFELLDACEDLEPTSALKQAAISHGIANGEDMDQFVSWALANSTIGIF